MCIYKQHGKRNIPCLRYMSLALSFKIRTYVQKL